MKLKKNFYSCLVGLMRILRYYPKLLEYVNNTWIAKYKEKIVACWTNTIMHFENTSTNMYTFMISCKFQKHNYNIILLTSSILTYLLFYLFRAESAHAKLKRYLGSTFQNFETSGPKFMHF